MFVQMRHRLIFIRRFQSESCIRCGLEVNNRESDCPHCKDLNDLQAKYFKNTYKEELVKKNKGLSVLFWKLTALAFLITLIFFMY